MSDYTPEAAVQHRETHGAYVAAGHCSAVAHSKAWCHGKKDHGGAHHSPYFHPGHKVESRFWTETATCPCGGSSGSTRREEEG